MFVLIVASCQANRVFNVMQKGCPVAHSTQGRNDVWDNAHEPMMRDIFLLVHFGALFCLWAFCFLQVWARFSAPWAVMENPLLPFLQKYNVEALAPQLTELGFDCVEDLEALSLAEIGLLEPEEQEVLLPVYNAIRKQPDATNNDPLLCWLRTMGLEECYATLHEHEIRSQEDLLANVTEFSQLARFGVALPGHQRKLFRRLHTDRGTAAGIFWEQNPTLQEEASLLLGHGFDEVEDLVDLQVADLVKLGIAKPGTRVKLVRLLQG